MAGNEKENISAAQPGRLLQQLDIVIGAGIPDPAFQAWIYRVRRAGAENRNLHIQRTLAIKGMVGPRSPGFSIEIAAEHPRQGAKTGLGACPLGTCTYTVADSEEDALATPLPSSRPPPGRYRARPPALMQFPPFSSYGGHHRVATGSNSLAAPR